MFSGGFYEDDTAMGGIFPTGLARRPGAAATPRRFDEYYRCYPVAMLPGPERENLNYGGKVIMPPSALDKLTRLHITYPMLFELINGAKDTISHAGVLEFIAEEGKIYLPFWLMQVLKVEPGDLLQIKSTDLPSGSFIKIQAQSTSFLDISDPKAVLENVLRNYACLTKGDIFTFEYNDQTFDMAVLETKPDIERHAISVLETDLEVDFATPVGYQEPPKRPSGTSTPRSATGGMAGHLPSGGLLHSHGTMAQAINYASIAPDSEGANRSGSSNFQGVGQRLNSRKSSKPSTPQSATPVGGVSSNKQQQQQPPIGTKPLPARHRNGPKPLRLPPGKLFFGYAIKPPPEKDGSSKDKDENESKFKGSGQTLKGSSRKR